VRAQRDAAAAAVEFALLLPVLMMFLFGIIQYGYGLFQLQQFTSTLNDASRLAATGITDCGLFKGSLQDLAGKNGLNANDVSAVNVQWLNAAGSPAPGGVPTRLGLAKVTATFTPFKIGIPFLPFPDTISRSQTVMIQDIGLNQFGLPLIGGC
jgi:hypothetical protein